MAALRSHFTGKGNTTRRIAQVDCMKETLHYKNERSMMFETFLSKCQNMFNIYFKEGEPMKEDAKIRFLFKKIENQGLQEAVEALKACITTGGPGS
eukprot:15081167-Ditylum_brightwellii.AAC.1